MAAPRSTNRKKIDTLWYSYRGVWEEESPEEDVEETPSTPPTVTDKKVKVEVWLIKTTDSANCKLPPYPVKELRFELSTPEVKNDQGKTFEVEGPDIEACRKALWGMLDEKFATRWEAHYKIKIELQPPYEGQGSTINFNYTHVEKGTAHDGTLLLREHRYPRGYNITPWPGVFIDKLGKTIACLPATPANTKALKEFSERVTELGDCMKTLLRPEKIHETLLALTQTHQIPLPRQLPDPNVIETDLLPTT